MERENFTSAIPLLVIMLGQGFGIFLAPYSQEIGLAVFILSILSVFPYFFYASWYAEHQARGHNLIVATITTSRGPASWRWRKRVQIWHQIKPKHVWVKNGFVPPQYRTNPEKYLGFWESYLVPSKKTTRHPRYNRKQKVPLFVLRHVQPWDRLVVYEEGQGSWNGFIVNLPGVCHMWLDEVMPSKERVKMMTPSGRIEEVEIPNGVPYTDDSYNEYPVFWIRMATGTRIIEEEMEEKKTERRKEMPTSETIEKRESGNSLVCLECNHELPMPPKGMTTTTCVGCGKVWDLAK